jgi:hypothetical protein
MDTWTTLNKELEYYGIHLITDVECECLKEDGTKVSQGIMKTIRMINKSINKHKQILVSLWDNACDLITEDRLVEECFHDVKIKKLFIFTLKDMSKFLLMFDIPNESYLSKGINASLDRDIKSFSSEQISEIIDYKISIDWIHRVIQRLYYICNLLAFASIGKEKVSTYDIKIAEGISGPWANLDLPKLERVYPFEQEEQHGRTKDKQHQRRYRKGFENYNNDGRVGEGHYWRELRNEPYSWFDNASESPYPHRNLLWN